MERSEWFEEWFNTPFYHILYQNRNEEEAARFVENITQVLKFKKGSSVLDLACGKGRHALSLNKMGFNVVGSDLSVNSISHAKKYENETLRFIVQDMREPIKNEKFCAIFNMFTSFGYFENTKDNLKVLETCGSMLKKGGFLIIDFMNTIKASKNLKKKEVKEIEGIKFNITRDLEKNHFIKTISFGHTGQSYMFTERVQNLQLKDFDKILKSANFTIKSVYGDYNLSDFDAEESNRLIIVAVKN